LLNSIAGISARLFGWFRVRVAVRCQRQVLPNRFRLSLYGLVLIRVVIAVVVAREQWIGFVLEDFADNIHLPPNGTARVISRLVLANTTGLVPFIPRSPRLSLNRGYLCSSYNSVSIKKVRGVGYYLGLPRQGKEGALVF
jgi:hypothetical protein